MDPNGAVNIGMSNFGTKNGGHPYELEQIENLNKIDQAKHLARQLEKLIEQDDFSDDSERKAAQSNLKCLKVYEFQQELRQEMLSNYMNN